MRKSVWVFLFLVAASLAFQPAFGQKAKKVKPSWTTYANTNGKVKAKFPAKPEITTEVTDFGKKHKAIARFKNGTYFINYTKHDNTLAEHKRLADVSLQAFNDKLNGTILSQSNWEVKKNVGKKAMIEIPEKEAKVDYRVVLVGQIQYQVIVVAPSAEWDEKTTKKFFKKFKITK